MALRIRARKSATGSVRLIPSPSFPVRPPRRKPARMGYSSDQCSVISVQQKLLAFAAALSSTSNSLTTDHCSLTTVLLPTRLHDARDFALERQAAEAQTAYAELAQVAAGTAAELAPVVLAGAELRLPRVFHSLCSG